jgi:DNA repair protein RadC
MQTDTTRLRELRVRYSLRKDEKGRPMTMGRILNSPSDAASVLIELLENEPAEVFAILCVTTKHRVIGYHEVSRGTLDSTTAHPREVFKTAVMVNAASILLAHNHPSGDPTPSSDDIQLTRRLIDAGEILGIQVLDHIIVGDGRYVSLRELGRL